MSYGIGNPNPGPSLNPPEPNWNDQRDCATCPTVVRIFELHRIDCLCGRTVHVCFDCRDRRVCDDCEACAKCSRHQRDAVHDNDMADRGALPAGVYHRFEEAE